MILTSKLRSSDHDARVRPQPSQQMQHCRFRHRNAARGRPEILSRQMQEHGAGAATDARRAVVVDLDDEIIEMVGALEPVAVARSPEAYGLVVMAAPGFFAPGVFRRDGANGQKCARSRVAIGAPPQLPGPEDAPGSPAIALALVGADAAPPQRDRHRLSAHYEPAPARIAGSRPDPDHGKRPVRRF